MSIETNISFEGAVISKNNFVMVVKMISNISFCILHVYQFFKKYEQDSKTRESMQVYIDHF